MTETDTVAYVTQPHCYQHQFYEIELRAKLLITPWSNRVIIVDHSSKGLMPGKQADVFIAYLT